MTHNHLHETFPDQHPPHKPLLQFAAEDWKALMGAGLSRLKEHSQIVNALNVFPVPDGDTGTNMVLTMQAAWKEASQRISNSVDEVAQAFAQGAIRGARGNSGVILSQILRGMAEYLQQKEAEVIDAQALAGALQQGKETAYKGVITPVEGTILTVIREAADAAKHAAALNSDLRFVLEATLTKAKQAVEDTPNLLPVLKKAGVVDAGGQGLYYLLEGMYQLLYGAPIPMPDQMATTMAPPTTQPDLEALGEEEWGYDIQFLIYGEHLDEQEIRRTLLEMGGESVVVGQSGPIVKVHVHSEDPGPFLSYGASLGYLDDIVLENMTLQTMRRKGEWDEQRMQPVTAPTAAGVPITAEAACNPIVAVAAGEGLARIFQSLGVCAIVRGGQTMNPSIDDLLQAADSLPQDEIIILPNNKNVILAAQQAAQLSTKQIHVLPTRTMPEGIAAMLAYHPEANVDRNLAGMQAAVEAVHTIEITTAVRDAHFDDVQVAEGDMIVLADGQLVSKGDDYLALILDALAKIDPDEEYELLSLYFGQAVSADEAQQLAAALQAKLPDYEVEVHEGGQPHYDYLIAVE